MSDDQNHLPEEPIASFSLPQDAPLSRSGKIETSERISVEPLQELEDQLRLEWWKPRGHVDCHVAIHYRNHQQLDWQKLLEEMTKQYSDRCVIVIGPQATDRDALAKEVREMVLSAGASWVSAAEGKEEEVRLEQESKLNDLTRTLTYSSSPLLALRTER
jgi:hypothetical protein